MMKKGKGFTLPEILVAVSIFVIVSTVIAGLYVQSFRETRRSNLQNQIYEDARFILQRIGDEIRSGAIDYDEYYNQNVVIGSGIGLANFGQNYGRYYSAFFNPGSDEKLGFTCNDGATRNNRSCTPLRRTLDKNTGENPFTGKYKPTMTPYPSEDAFCGTVSYNLGITPNHKGLCNGTSPDPMKEQTQIKELYLISADARKKTIIARERIGGTTNEPVYALAILKLDGVDTNSDSIMDSFVCSSEFQCRGSADVAKVSTPSVPDPACDATAALPVELPRSRTLELEAGDEPCDPKSAGFSKDFVPISPFRVNIKDVRFIITPAEDPRYGFSEDNPAMPLIQPRVTIILTVVPNPEFVTQREAFAPITLLSTVSAGILTPVPAPLLIQ